MIVPVVGPVTIWLLPPDGAIHWHAAAPSFGYEPAAAAAVTAAAFAHYNNNSPAGLVGSQPEIRHLCESRRRRRLASVCVTLGGGIFGSA
jgi:hypothetical protein